MTTFTVDQVRELACKASYEYKRECGDMLHAYADRLEADGKAMPVGEILTRGPDEGCARIRWADAEKRETMTPRELAKRIERGEKWKLADEPAPCQSQNAERLAEALRSLRASVMDGLVDALRHQRQIDEDGVEVGVSRQAVDEAANILAMLAAQESRNG